MTDCSTSIKRCAKFHALGLGVRIGDKKGTILKLRIRKTKSDPQSGGHLTGETTKPSSNYLFTPCEVKYSVLNMDSMLTNNVDACTFVLHYHVQTTVDTNKLSRNLACIVHV